MIIKLIRTVEDYMSVLEKVDEAMVAELEVKSLLSRYELQTAYKAKNSQDYG